jgi:hypothetical protein
MNQRNDWVYFLVVFVVLPAGYVLYRALPDIIFLFFPFVAVSWVLGHAWKKICEVKPINYQPVAGLMTVSMVLLAATIGIPREPVFIGKNRVRIESPFLFKTYNDFQRSIDTSINGTFLSRFRIALPGLIPPAEYEPKPFDLRYLAWSLWLAVCIGAPAIFLFYAKKEDRERVRTIEEYSRKEIRRQKQRRINVRISKATHRRYYRREIAIRSQEIKRLKELVATLPNSGGPPPPDGCSDPTPPDPGGIFSSNDF